MPFQSSNKKIRKWGFIWGKTSQKQGFHLGKNITKIGVCNQIVKHTKVPFDLQKKNTKIRASNCPHEAMAAIHLCYSFPTEHYLFFLNRRILAFSLNRKVQFSFSYFSSLACVSQPQHSLHLLSRVTALLSFKIIKIMNAAQAGNIGVKKVRHSIIILHTITNQENHIFTPYFFYTYMILSFFTFEILLDKKVYFCIITSISTH